MTLPKLRYFLREALHNLWQFKTRHLFSLTIICLSFVTVGVVLSLSGNLRNRAKELSKNLTVVFYLRQDATDAEREAVESRIRRSPLIGGVRSVSPEQALDRFQTNFPDLRDILRNLGTNPFPASVEASLKDGGSAAEAILAFIAEVRQSPGVEDVQFSRDWADKVRALGRLVEAVGFFLGGILILASFFIISNVIKLNVLARRSEIEILRLVGATNTFIRVPFLIEGVMMGVAGSALSLLIVLVLVKSFPLYLGSSLGALQELISFRFLRWTQVLGLLGGGGLVGFFGSLSSIARFLKI
jgi:cell division transport system permease protein